MKYLLMMIALISFNVSCSAESIFVEDLVDAIALSENTKQDVLVIFGADWCKYCSVMKQDILDDVKIVDNLIVCYIDIDKHTELKKEYKVKTIPDYFIMRDKKEIKRKVGYNNKSEFITWLSK